MSNESNRKEVLIARELITVSDKVFDEWVADSRSLGLSSMALRVCEWNKLPLSIAELCIDTTLRCGQSFRWRKIGDEWHCSLQGRIVSLRQDPTHLHYRATWPSASQSATPESKAASSRPVSDDTEVLLRGYLNLQLDLSSLYEQWSRDDANFRKKAPKFAGIRILNQDAWEALVAFICSSNNNISRISQMVPQALPTLRPLPRRIGDEAFHDFPTAEALTGAQVESHLRELGFGYRAKYIAATARMVATEKPAGWLMTLRNPESPSRGDSSPSNPEAKYKDAHEQLLTLVGVGSKVADCVCLMGLGWGEAVPVDTHVWQIAVRDYKFAKTKTKTFSKVMYDAVGDHFRALWGKQAGWAQSVLFTANLKSFSDRLTAKNDTESLEVKEEEVVIGGSNVESRKRKTVVAEGKADEGGKDASLVGTVATRTSKRRRTRS